MGAIAGQFQFASWAMKRVRNTVLTVKTLGKHGAQCLLALKVLPRDSDGEKQLYVMASFLWEQSLDISDFRAGL